MTFSLTEEESVRNDQLSAEAEMKLNEEEARRDLKEQRGVTKQTMYEGSKKLKHILPKGKHI